VDNQPLACWSATPDVHGMALLAARAGGTCPSCASLGRCCTQASTR
jgi:hypothetical protein